MRLIRLGACVCVCVCVSVCVYPMDESSRCEGIDVETKSLSLGFPPPHLLQKAAEGLQQATIHAMVNGLHTGLVRFVSQYFLLYVTVLCVA